MMANGQDFVIRNGALTKYKSFDNNVVTQESVTEIGEQSFYCCENLAIHAHAESFAEEYAQRKKIRFKALS